MMIMGNPVFAGISEDEYRELSEMGYIRKSLFRKDETVIHAGDITKELGILTGGKVYIENIDFWGNRMILHYILPGQAFAEAYALSGIPVRVNVTASEKSEVLFFSIADAINVRNSSRSWYAKITANMLKIATEKNIAWSDRMFCISAKKIRERVMNYLSSEAARCGSRKITVPFDRQQMADYLNVERSALSKELGKMRDEGIIRYRKNVFELVSAEIEV